MRKLRKGRKTAEIRVLGLIQTCFDSYIGALCTTKVSNTSDSNVKELLTEYYRIINHA